MTIPHLTRRAAPSSWIIKFFECFFAVVAVINVLISFSEVLPKSLLIMAGGNFFSYVLWGQLWVGLFAGIGISIYWHRNENRHRIDSGRVHAWLRGILRYWLAVEISTYGFAKILKTQFAQIYYRDDIPVGDLDGFSLTWNYFGHSYSMAVIIAILQIGGSILLLFRRTTLSGVFILLPVMVNISLINLFFHIAPGAFMNSVLFTGGLLFLLLMRWEDLKPIIFKPGSDLPPIRLGVFKYLFRFLAIGCAFGVIYYYTSRNPPATLAGKWKVNRLIRNRDTIQANAWLTDPRAWSTVYMEENGMLSLCPNPYVYDEVNSQKASYSYDGVKHRLQLIFNSSEKQKDTTIASVSLYPDQRMQWNGVFGKDTLLVQLAKVDSRKG